MISSRISGQLDATSDSSVFRQKLKRSAAGMPTMIETNIRMGPFRVLDMAYDQFCSVFHRPPKRPWAMPSPVAVNME